MLYKIKIMILPALNKIFVNLKETEFNEKHYDSKYYDH